MKVLLVACFALLSAASAMPAVSQWSLQELSDAVQDPSTDPLVLPYLVQALDDMMLSLWHGVDQTIATVVLPAAVVEAITPVVVAPAPEPEAAVVPVVDATEVKSSPLVQIILNINQAAAPAAVATPVETPVVPEAVAVPVAPETVGVAVLPETVGVAVLPETVGVAVLPETVGVAVLPETVGVAVLPETVGVAVLPETVGVATPVNPIDFVMIEPVQVNPIDLISPVNPVAVVGAGTMIEPVGIHV